MSFQAMTWACEQNLPCSQKMVLLMLANRTNSDTGRCDPSHEKLAFDCGLSHQTVKDQIKKLQEMGLLKIIRRKRDTVDLTNQYVLLINAEIARTADFEDFIAIDCTIRGGRQLAQVGTAISPRGGQPLAPNQEVESVKEPYKVKNRKTSIPQGFEISENIRRWANEKGFTNLEEHLENFVGVCQAKNYQYVDWNAAFQNAIRSNWAKIKNDQSYDPFRVVAKPR